MGIVTDANEVHPLNAPTPMFVTKLGIVIDVNEVHKENAPSIILVTVEVGVNVTDVNELHP